MVEYWEHDFCSGLPLQCGSVLDRLERGRTNGIKLRLCIIELEKFRGTKVG